MPVEQSASASPLGEKRQTVSRQRSNTALPSTFSEIASHLLPSRVTCEFRTDNQRGTDPFGPAGSPIICPPHQKQKSPAVQGTYRVKLDDEAGSAVALDQSEADWRSGLELRPCNQQAAPTSKNLVPPCFPLPCYLVRHRRVTRKRLTSYTNRLQRR